MKPHNAPYTSGDLGPSGIGTDDTLVAPNEGAAYVGDAGGNIFGKAGGGWDTITGAAGVTGVQTLLDGDCAGNMLDNALGGQDRITGGANKTAGNNHANIIYGDSQGAMEQNSVGGADILTGGAGASVGNLIFGDAYSINDYALGGNDIITGAAKSNGAATTGFSQLIGDSSDASGYARGGNDTLISGNDDDEMWGDFLFIYSSTTKGGNDQFAFAARNGHDIIHDFGQGGVSSADGFNHGRDVIEITSSASWNVHQFSDLTFTQAFDSNTHTTIIQGSGAPGANDITVTSDHALSAHDFLFA